jgi:uncharacterized membrane protein
MDVLGIKLKFMKAITEYTNQFKSEAVVTATLFLALVLSANDALAFTEKGAGWQDTGINNFVENITSFINTTLIPFALALAFFVFIWGVFQYFIAGGANEEKRESGKQLMIYSILGFTLIVVIWGIVNFLASSLGFEDTKSIEVPKVPIYTPPA